MILKIKQTLEGIQEFVVSGELFNPLFCSVQGVLLSNQGWISTAACHFYQESLLMV